MNKCLVLFGSAKQDYIYNRFSYLIRVIRVIICITYAISHNYAKIKVGSYDSLPLRNKHY